jgi:hypothetical protein
MHRIILSLILMFPTLTEAQAPEKIISLQKLDSILFHTHPLTQQKTSIQ